MVEVVKPMDLGSDEKVKADLAEVSIHKAMLEVSGFVGNQC